jgi:heme-degrading monooxygenase HmoA
LSVKIIIKRTVPENKIKDLMPLLIRLRTIASNQPGYISGETLKGIDKPSNYMVISTWRSIEDWKKWSLSKERTEIQKTIDSLLDDKTLCEIYNYA